jgi:hypothetical protein
MHWLWDPATRKPPSSTHISPMHSYTLGDDKDDEEAFMYAQRFRQLDRKLTFFHIPKTAGTVCVSICDRVISTLSIVMQCR